MAPRYYKHSGGFSPVGVGLGLVIGIAATFGLGFAYTYLSTWIPLIYLRALFLFGMALGTGMVLGTLGTVAAVRNTPLMFALGAVISASAVYCQWIAYFHANSSPGIWLVDPSEMWAMLGLMAKTGVWTIFDWTPTGGALWAFWIVEAAIITGGTLLVGLGMMDSPYCEVTQCWADEGEVVGDFELPDDVGAFVAQVAQDPVAVLHDHPSPDDDAPPIFLRAQVSFVKAHPMRSTYFLSMSQVVLSYDDDGDVKEDTGLVMPHLIIERDVAEALLQG